MREKINENQKIPAWATFKKYLDYIQFTRIRWLSMGGPVVALRLSDDYLSICFHKVTSVDRMFGGMT